ncbi:MAG: biotin--[acetyl-CoA-carboxylase] ligase [Desulfovibrio sp.]
MNTGQTSQKAPIDEAPRAFVYPRVDSTMDTARTLDESLEYGPLNDWETIFAESQTSGRGQLRREWHSPKGNIYATLMLPTIFSYAANDKDQRNYTDLLPLIAGYLLCSALEKHGFDILVKWPNDILLQGRKVGGILVEQRGDKTYCGIGLNLCHAPSDEQMRADAAMPAGTMINFNQKSPRDTWLTLVNSMKKEYLSLFKFTNLTEFVILVSQRLAWMGQNVLVHESESITYQGTLVGLAENGALLIDKAGQTIELTCGSILPLRR